MRSPSRAAAAESEGQAPLSRGGVYSGCYQLAGIIRSHVEPKDIVGQIRYARKVFWTRDTKSRHMSRPEGRKGISQRSARTARAHAHGPENVWREQR